MFIRLKLLLSLNLNKTMVNISLEIAERVSIEYRSIANRAESIQGRSRVCSSYLAVVVAFHDSYSFFLFLLSFSTYFKAYRTAVIYWIKLLFKTN